MKKPLINVADARTPSETNYQRFGYSMTELADMDGVRVASICLSRGK
jgi:hypothetical protein